MSAKNELVIENAVITTHFKDEEIKNRPVNPECVYMYSQTYEDIFGTALKNTDRRKRFVKISSDQSRFSIWRTWRGTNISKNEIVLDCDGKAVLDGNNNDAVTTLKIKKTNWFDYYWHTDNTAARVSFKVGIVSMLVGTALGVVSLIF